jgi:hypothetical protein
VDGCISVFLKSSLLSCGIVLASPMRIRWLLAVSNKQGLSRLSSNVKFVIKDMGQELHLYAL